MKHWSQASRVLVMLGQEREKDGNGGVGTAGRDTTRTQKDRSLFI